MLGIVGTVPWENFPLSTGDISLKDDHLMIGGSTVPVNRGTPALMAAAWMTADVIGTSAPFGYLAGDIGRGKGSRSLYNYLAEQLPKSHFQTLTFHYLQPIIHWHERLQAILMQLQNRPFLIADAGYMYVAKMSGKASLYDLFTPDVGELAFLADEKAPHPFYTRGFILHDENKVPDLISRAYRYGNAARHLIVKGRQDYFADKAGILATVDSPVEEALEAMGGTGDTLTGIVSALIDSGIDVRRAAVIAMKANRLAGRYAQPTPATQVMEVIRHIPNALREVIGTTDDAVFHP
ncbi:MAG TPA: sugar kinase [Deltaproteobacteria bacterium]|nr:sugar kinase [Deltaproteobacteria bacterium]